MIIEIVGTGFTNNGAELMLAATVDRLSQSIPKARFAADPSIGPYHRRARYGLLQRFDAKKAGRLGWLREKLFHEGYRRRFGLILERDVSVVLDASGFSLGDDWPEIFADSRARSFTRWRSQGKHIVLLPQAFGPFRRHSTRKLYRQVLEAADLVFARDPSSFDHVKNLVPDHPGLGMARDFTNLVPGTANGTHDPNRQWAGIIPNAMMVREKPHEIRVAYVTFLVQCAEQLLRRGIEPCVVLYETNMDQELGKEVCESIRGGINLLVEEDPIRLKGITGTFLLTIGSRYHGLVNALSQGVPSIGTSWSHKYQALFNDYGRPDWLVDLSKNSCVPTDLITRIVDNRDLERNHLLGYASVYKEESEAMWRQVETLIVQ